MKTTPIRIMLLESKNCHDNKFLGLLSAIGYEITLLDQIDAAIKIIENSLADIVIYKSNSSGDNGFKVFKILRPFVLKAGMPFLLYFDEFKKDNILIGLEIGVDNFIIPPFEEDSVKFKIENVLKKKLALDVFDTENFKICYNSSLVAMFYIANNKIKSVNPAFSNHVQVNLSLVLNQIVSDVFYINEIPENELKFIKFRSGVIRTCILKNVLCLVNKTYFDLCLFRGNKNDGSSIFCEMLPAQDNNFYSEGVSNFKTLTKDSKNGKFKGDVNLNGFKLTEKEKLIYNLSAQGLAIKQIAVELNISQRTVEKHRSNIMRKTNTSNFIETIAKVQQTYADEK